MKNISEMRKDYKMRAFNETEADPDPFRQFKAWFLEVTSSDITEPNAMTLATVSEDMRPEARIVLLKSITEEGFMFFTNYESAKGRSLEKNPSAALVFAWLDLERQVRIEGLVEKVSRAESENYFHSRPRSSQISAYISPQSNVIKTKKEIEEKWAEAERTFEGKEIPLPEYWGGYIVKPDLFEFWQGRSNRLHDRLQYVKEGGGWKIQRLAP